MGYPDNKENQDAKDLYVGSTYRSNSAFIDTSQVAIALFADDESFGAVMVLNLLELLQHVTSLRRTADGIMQKNTILLKMKSAVLNVVGDTVELAKDMGELGLASATAIASTQGQILSGKMDIDASKFEYIAEKVRKKKDKYCVSKSSNFGDVNLYLNDFFSLGDRIGAFVENTINSLSDISEYGLGVMGGSRNGGIYFTKQWKRFVRIWKNQIVELGEMFTLDGSIDLSPICNTLNNMIQTLQDLVGIQSDILDTVNKIVNLINQFVKQLLSLIEKIKKMVAVAFTGVAIVGVISLSLVSLGAVERLLRGMIKELKGIVPKSTLRNISIILDSLDINVRNSILSGEISKVLGDPKIRDSIKEIDSQLEVLHNVRLGIGTNGSLSSVLIEVEKRYGAQFVTINEVMVFLNNAKSDFVELRDLNARQVEFSGFYSKGKVIQNQNQKKKDFNKKLDLFCKYKDKTSKSVMCDLKKKEN